ncbi:MAG: BamA/TamA family outer membrane protein [Hymenobacteraceae bacterium]|nr:BamA/TamA family outer membrane protein [Hymenobacteraceae bacterium]
MRKTLLLLGLLLSSGFSLSGRAQGVHLRWQMPGAVPGRAALRRVRLPLIAPDSLAALAAVRDVIFALRADSYLTASADSIRWPMADSVRVALHLGPRLRWATVRATDDVPDGLLARAGFRERLLRNQALRPAELVRLQQAILRECEDHGYPFAQVRLDSVRWFGTPADQLSAVLRLERGPLIVMDSVLVEGNATISRGFLSRYLQIFPGQPYSQGRLAAAARLLRQVPYLQSTGAPRVRFAADRARITFFLADRRANQFDGLVGVLPVNNPAPGAKRVQVTGEVNLALRNIKGGGKSLNLNWRKADANSTALDAGYAHPGLLGSPLELIGTFNLLRQANQFVTTRPRLEFAYPTARRGRVSFFAEFRASRLLSDSSFRGLTALPLNLDSRYPNYGLTYAFNALDDPFFPRRGWNLSATGAAGNKSIRRNPDVPEALYATVRARTSQLTGGLRAERYTRTGRSSTLLTRLRADGIYNADRLFDNDLFRLGGLATLRGFDEWQFFVSSYAVATAEYRVFTGDDAYVFLFADQGYYRRDRTPPASAARPRDWPGGAGLGVTFSTGAGVFQFVYAVGRATGQAPSLTRGKIHFGITGRF